MRHRHDSQHARHAEQAAKRAYARPRAGPGTMAGYYTTSPTPDTPEGALFRNAHLRVVMIHDDGWDGSCRGAGNNAIAAFAPEAAS
jgi:hypothetical protein